jgi:hypothetical protein
LKVEGKKGHSLGRCPGKVCRLLCCSLFCISPFDRSDPSEPTSTPSTVFCQKCIQNQNILVRLLSAYDPADEDYFNLTVEKYRQRLERQYPPVCSRCEPVVNNRLIELARNTRARIAAASLAASQKLSGLAGMSTGCVNGKTMMKQFSWTYFAIWSMMVLAVLGVHFLTISVYLRGL